ncbi:MAG: hypothetical protein FWE11_09565 [Defluviitaleaceae bacterium]|nr:hypothetical protein [Defluviitaleaceae bacterium]
MASSVSLEYLKSLYGQPGGLPTLDGDGEIPIGQLPSIVALFKGQFVDEAALVDEFPTASLACYAFVDDTSSFWYWNAGLEDPLAPAWVNQEITEDDYDLLTDLAKSMVPYIIIPTPTPPTP